MLFFHPSSPISPSFDSLCSPQEVSICQKVKPAHTAAPCAVCLIPLLPLLLVLLGYIIHEAFC